jgi:hypothetical protein
VPVLRKVDPEKMLLRSGESEGEERRWRVTLKEKLVRLQCNLPLPCNANCVHFASCLMDGNFALQVFAEWLREQRGRLERYPRQKWPDAATMIGKLVSELEAEAKGE